MSVFTFGAKPLRPCRPRLLVERFVGSRGRGVRASWWGAALALGVASAALAAACADAPAAEGSSNAEAPAASGGEGGEAGEGGAGGSESGGEPGGSDPGGSGGAGGTAAAGAPTAAGGGAMGGAAQAGAGGQGAGGQGELAPFAPLPDASMGLTNVDASLEAVLEHGALAGACEAYANDPGNAKKRLLCGKSMFFYEGFGTSGVPKPLITWLLASFAEEMGPGFSKLGMVPDPYSPEHLPLGLAAGAPFGTVGSMAFSCASCHFGRLPDGRFAVGAANHDLSYGRFFLAVAMVPMTTAPGWNDAAHDPLALSVIQPLRAKLASNVALQLSLLSAISPLLAGGVPQIPALSKENERHYAEWRPGTMDFFIQPLPFDDQVHTVSKINALWGVPSSSELEQHSIPSAMLGWSGGTSSLGNFLHSFVELGGGKPAEWPADRLAPLGDYIATLRAPASPQPPPAEAVDAGRAVFASSCMGCHGGPRGMGDHVFSFAEIGTDAAMQWWADGPDHDGKPCCKLTFPVGDTVTNGIKSPRLVGLWAAKRFLHNGSLDSLEQLLCLAPRPGVTEPAFGDGGHTFGCDLPEADRAALVAYLRAH